MVAHPTPCAETDKPREEWCVACRFMAALDEQQAWLAERGLTDE